MPKAHVALRTPRKKPRQETERWSGCTGKTLLFFFSSPFPIRGQKRTGWEAHPGRVPWPEEEWAVGHPHPLFQKALKLPWFTLAGCPEGPHQDTALCSEHSRGALPARPHHSICAPAGRLPDTHLHTTNHLHGHHAPSSSGTARCSWSWTKRRTLLSASSHCPHPPALRSEIVLILIFHSAAIQWRC